MRWLHSLTRITYFSKLIGMSSLAALLGRASPRWGPAQALFKMLKPFVLQLELFRI